MLTPLCRSCLWLALLSSMLVGCGGGGGDGGSNQVADITPNSFTFSTQSDRPLNTEVISNTIVVAGIDTPVDIAVSDGGAYRIDGGEFTSDPGTISDGATVAVRQTSSTEFLSTTSVTLSVGSVNEVFRVTTEASPPVTISGSVTYDFVPHLSGGGLDYGNISPLPVRGVTVLALNNFNQTLASTTTDSDGDYLLEVNANTDVRIRVLAEMAQTGPPSWDVSVVDNTASNVMYAMQGSLTSSGTENSTRDLHANSGWNGISYANERAAAPFAILDSAYQSMEVLISSDSDIAIGEVQFRWSEQNRAISGDLTKGEIGTSFYNGDAIYILGDANNDTDEYDRSVVQHEFAHYLDDALSRSDSIGGPHSLSSKNDMRLAFSEGFANAFTAICSGSPIYKDSGGGGQAFGFAFNIEETGISNAGWYTENSVSMIVYDIFDDNDDGADSLSLGFSPIYNAWTSEGYRNGSARASIYSFAQALRAVVNSSDGSALDSLLSSENIFGSDEYGSGETNDGGSTITLPIYSQLSIGETVNLCSNNIEDSFNGFDVRRFVRITIPVAGGYEVSATKTSGNGERDPDILVFQNSDFIASFLGEVADSETGSFNIVQAGAIILEIYDFLNLPGDDPQLQSCFDVSVN